jgi:hypothetical protein
VPRVGVLTPGCMRERGNSLYDDQLAENLARRGTQKSLSVTEAKAKVIELIQQGFKVEQACAVVGRSAETYRDWRKNDPQFKAAIDSIRAVAQSQRQNGKLEVPDFETFCRDYLKQPLYQHQLRMHDVIDGREPRNMHFSFTYEAGYEDRVLINVPPEHAKSTTFTVNWVVWNIVKNPDIRIVLVSKGLRLAENFLYEIKLKLTSPLYREMHMAFGPDQGFQDPDNAWTADRIYVRGKNENIEAGVQKDPTVQAMGLKGTIYGQRADIIILDDIIDADNAREVETQLRKINRDISSRLPDGGLLLCLGTRVAPMDIYRVLSEIEDADGKRVWTYFRMPAVMDYGNGDSDTWETLWPWRLATEADLKRKRKKRREFRCAACYVLAPECVCDHPDHQWMVQQWDGPQLARRKIDAGWNLYYQQLDVDDDMTFKAEAVNASVNGSRFPGPMTVDGVGHRPEGMAGLYIAIGLDPAASGNTAVLVSGMERDTLKRWVIDGWNKTNASAGDIIAKFKELTDLYHPNEWVIEKNALQRFITQLPEIVEYARARGVKITPHFTTSNKFDADWGVQTMGPLFDSCVEWDAERKRWRPTGKGLIELPSTRQNPWVAQLVQQLTIWQPEGMAQKQKTDLVMALWFTHLAFMAQINRKKNKQTHYNTPFTTAAARSRRQVISLVELREAKRQQMEGMAS